MFFGKGYPATKSKGYGKSKPVTSKGVSPFGFGKPFGKGVGKGFGKGYPATKAGGYGSSVPVTSVATSPFGAI